MKPFVVNRYGRIVFPFNFIPELDFSVFETLEQFAAVIKRDFEEKAPTETDIVARVEARHYKGRYELLRDLALNLSSGSTGTRLRCTRSVPPAGATFLGTGTTCSCRCSKRGKGPS